MSKDKDFLDFFEEDIKSKKLNTLINNSDLSLEYFINIVIKNDKQIPSLHLKLTNDNADNTEELFNIYSEEMTLINELEKINQKPFLTPKNKEDIELFHKFCAKTELLKVSFLRSFMAVNELIPYDKKTINSVLETLIPSCSYNEETEVFSMELNFVPYLKFNTVKEFAKVKNVVLRLITEGINRMKIKPKYDKNAVLIIFTLYSPYLFDVDNVEFKYIIDAFRYSGFFYDDNCNCVSYMVEGNQTKKHPLIKVKIIKKSDLKLCN